MNTFEMMRSGQLHPIALWLPLFQLMILISVIVVAVKKHYKPWVPLILGLIPFVSIFALIVYVGLPTKTTAKTHKQ